MTKKTRPTGTVLYYKRFYQDLNNNYVWKEARVLRTKGTYAVLDNGDQIQQQGIKRPGGVMMYKPAPGFTTSYYSKMFKV